MFSLAAANRRYSNDKTQRDFRGNVEDKKEEHISIPYLKQYFCVALGVTLETFNLVNWWIRDGNF